MKFTSKYFFSVLFLLIVVFFGYYFFEKFTSLDIGNNLIYLKNKVADSQFLSKTENSSSGEIDNIKNKVSFFFSDENDLKQNYQKLSSTQSVKDYLDTLNKNISGMSDLNSILSARIYSYYLYPYTVAITDRGPRSDKTVQAYNGLYDIYQQNLLQNKTNKKDGVNRNVLQYLYLTYQSSCFIYSDLAQSSWSGHPTYIASNNKYPNDKQLAVQVFFENLLKDGSMQDKLYLSTRAFIVARILDDFEDKLSIEDKAYYIKDLSELLKAYEDKQPDTYTDRERAIIFTSSFYSYAYAVMSKYDKSITNEMVVNNFKSNADKIKGTLIAKDDSWGSFVTLIQAMQLEYVYNSNGKKIDNEVKLLISDIINYAKNAQVGDISYTIKFYFENIQNDMANWDNIRTNLVEVAKKDKDLKDFLVSFGLKI